MVAINGYDVTYTHRASWKANRSYKGNVIDKVPVAWDRDWIKLPGKPPSLVVWFENPKEASERLSAGIQFVVAVAKKVETGSSSANIHGLFDVAPVELTADPKAVRCTVLAKSMPPKDA